jgi:hypothetical protein
MRNWFGCICDKRKNSSPGDPHTDRCLEYNRKLSEKWERQEKPCSGSGYSHAAHGNCPGYTFDRT